MQLTGRIRTGALVVLLVNTAHAQDYITRPLFSEDSALALTIEAPFRRLAREADDREELDGIVRYRNAAGREFVLDAEIRVRGKSRLRECDFPPLRVDFDRSELDGTVFSGQNHLKLVTLCKRRDTYRDYLAEEYQIYRAYNALTNYSFRVRWLSVEYVDTEDERAEPFTEPAFFIEEDWEVAERHGLKALAAPGLELGELNARELALMSLFQFMIGNTDWAGTAAAPDEEDCCHNGKPIGSAEHGVIVLPYDFDNAGLVNAEYAAPIAGLRIRSVRQRLYRGYCATNPELDAVVQQFNDKRAVIERVFDSEPIDERARRRTLDYISDFYEIINDHGDLEDDIVDRCRK
jgi:hypothetical protein